VLEDPLDEVVLSGRRDGGGDLHALTAGGAKFRIAEPDLVQEAGLAEGPGEGKSGAGLCCGGGLLVGWRSIQPRRLRLRVEIAP
jgi:hypothetical protein